jgi:hypothetical protein
MSTDRDTTRLVRSWLEEGVTALPDRVLDAVLDQVPATHQRRPWWPTRRFADMNTYAKLATAAAAVLLVAVVGYQLLPSKPGLSGGVPTPSPSPTPALSPSATPALPTGSLAPGTYTQRGTAYTSAPFSFAVPAGWSYADGNIFKGTHTEAAAVTIDSWLVDHVYPDACRSSGRSVAVGPTKAELVAALTAQVGVKRTGPTSVTFGGLPATRFVLAEAAGMPASGCDGGILHIWADVGGSDAGGEPIAPGSTQTIYVIESAGHATAFAVQRPQGTSAADLAELQSILDSVTFLP